MSGRGSDKTSKYPDQGRLRRSDFHVLPRQECVWSDVVLVCDLVPRPVISGLCYASAASLSSSVCLLVGTCGVAHTHTAIRRAIHLDGLDRIWAYRRFDVCKPHTKLSHIHREMRLVANGDKRGTPNCLSIRRLFSFLGDNHDH